MTGFSSIGSISGVLPPDFNINTNTMGNNETTRIKAVSKAMETMFANQLSQEMSKEISGSDNPDDPDSGSSQYSDFIQQALSQGLTSGKGLGLASQIESYLTKRELQDARNAQEFPESKLKEKLDKIRRLGQQNRTLLEHSLFFLQQLFQQVLDRDTPLHLYNLNGHNFQSDLGGGILETRI